MRPRWWALASSATGLVGLIAGWVIAQAVQSPGYDPVRQTISVLAGHGAEHRWIMTLGLYLIGIGHLVTAAGLRGVRIQSRLLLALGGLAGLGVATFAEPRHGSTAAHLAFAGLGIVVLAIWPMTVVRRGAWPFPLRVRDALPVAILSAALLAWIAQAIHGTTLGLAERVITAQQTAWPVLVVLTLRRAGTRTGVASAAPQADRMSA